ncbi:MAG: nucleotidyltransferase family protein [Myxococcaceae bacterium]
MDQDEPIRVGQAAKEEFFHMGAQKAVAVILAAGEGKRMGFPKALLEYEKNRSFLGHLASIFSKAGCDPLAVTGKDTELVRTHHPELRVVSNPDWEDGQFSSVRKGLQAALDEGADVIAIHPVDMPTVRVSTVSSLFGKLNGSQGVVPEFEGATGHPLLLTRGAVEQVLQMQDVPHLEAAISRLNIKRVNTKDPGVMVNLNTPDVYERILGSAPHLAPAKKRRGQVSEAGEPNSPQ